MNIIAHMNNSMELVLPIGLAAVAGIVLGANRWLHHKSAGVKTHALVAIGACVAVMIVMPPYLANGQNPTFVGDAASRVLQGLITGIGFLGAGVIIHNARGKRIQGLTTAASIWITTIIGATFGMGKLELGLIALAAVGLILLTGNSIEKVVNDRFGHSNESDRTEDQP